MHVSVGGTIASGRALDVHVAVPAVEAQLPRVQPVRVRHRLLGRVPDLREPGRKVVPDEERHRDEPQGGGRAHDQRQLVQGAREDLHGFGGLGRPVAVSANLRNAGGLGITQALEQRT